MNRLSKLKKCLENIHNYELTYNKTYHTIVVSRPDMFICNKINFVQPNDYTLYVFGNQPVGEYPIIPIDSIRDHSFLAKKKRLKS